MNTAVLSIGSNIGDRLSNIKKCLSFIKKKSHSILVSPFYITRPMYYTNQPYFINCAVKIETSFSPFELLKFIGVIEKNLKRKRLFKNSPRTIDIDIIYFNDIIMNEKKLTLPHPKLYERGFVLKPLCDIDEKFIDPLKKKSVYELCMDLNNFKSDIIKIPENYDELLDFISEIQPRDINDFKTDYIKDTLDLFGNPQNKCGKIIHITGSCGKTTSAFYISELLKRNGYMVCLYTSPHIIDIRERIIANGKMISRKNFYDIFLEIISSSKHMHSIFEYLTLVAIIYFSTKNPDYSVVEVGMGGRDDATNIFKKSISVFTTITEEHQKYLGKDIKSIAENKSGIIKKNGKVFVSSLNDDDVIKVLKKAAAKNNNRFYISRINSYKSKNIFDDMNFSFANFITQKIINHKIKNEKKYIKNLFPARHQVIKYKKINILLDGAHTPVSMRLLLNYDMISDYKICLAGFMNDKKVDEMLRIMKKNNFKSIILTVPSSKRSFYPTNYIADKVTVIVDLKEALEYALKFNENILVTGSLYFCADILSIIKKKKKILLNELSPNYRLRLRLRLRRKRQIHI
jgi:dihydrofolate synthase/folylpolyglutamate synthase